MSKILVIVPTIDGREKSLFRCLDTYKTRTPKHEVEMMVLRNYDTCGIAWGVGMELAKHKDFDYIQLSADDLEPHEGWAEPAIAMIESGKLPAPKILNPDGSLFSFGHNAGKTSVVPMFKKEHIERVLPMAPWHYWTDDYVSHKLGLPVENCEGYTFTHHADPVGRLMSHNDDMVKWNHYQATGDLI